jgi:hypothetical protein
VCVVVGWVTVVSRVDVVVVVGSDEQELNNIVPSSDSSEVRMMDFFIVWELFIPKRIRAKPVPQMYAAGKNYKATIGTSRPAELDA